MSVSDVLHYGSVIPRLEGYDGGLMAADEGSATSSLVLLERIRETARQRRSLLPDFRSHRD